MTKSVTRASGPNVQVVHVPAQLQSCTLTDTRIRTLTQLLTPALTDMNVHHHVARTNTAHQAQVSGVSKVENASQCAGWRLFCGQARRIAGASHSFSPRL